MHYKQRQELTIVKVSDNEKKFSFRELEEIILEKPSDIIYCERNEKLYGIISMGDIARARGRGKGCVAVNTHFTSVFHSGQMKARKIFGDKADIHELPVVNEDNMLLGAYTRCDDLLLYQYALPVCRGGGQYSFRPTA